MGRSAYTPSTLSYLVHRSEHERSNSSSPRYTSSGSNSPSLESDGGDDQQVKPPTLEDLLFSNSAGNAVAGNSNHRAFGRFNEPVTWSQCKFDPDDERLPVVIERPVGPDDFFNASSNNTNDEQNNQETVLIDEEEQMLAVSTAAALNGRQGQGWTLSSADAYAAYAEPGLHDDEEEEEDIEEDDDEDEDEDEDTMQSGNGDYDDYPTSTRARASNARPVAAPSASLDGFSPSVGVFHTHTLPFNLPNNPNELHVQRRLGSGANGNLLARDINDIM